MPLPPLIVADDAPDLVAGLQQIRADLDVPGPHGAEAAAEAEEASARVLGGLDASVGTGRVDLRDVELVTIDPPGSRDLDQALHLERRAGGYRLRYAIADVGPFVAPGSALDEEVWSRGVTYYLPDARAPLHPAVLGEGAASLLPDQDRPAVVWTVDLDADGATGDVRLERAVVRSRAQLTYTGVQETVDAGRADGTLALLAEVGPLRQAIEAARGGVSLDLPTQRVTRQGDGYRLEHEHVVAAMGWNAQISLLVGMAAAAAMVKAGIGLLRTLPPPDREVVRTVRRSARALGVAWPEGASYASVVRGLDGDVPAQAALLAIAARGLRGAGYLALAPGIDPPSDDDHLRHAAVAAPYAHVTAPLRRLADRPTTEVCLALFEGAEPDPDLVASLPALPKAMARASGREGNAARAVIDLVEALLLAPREGEVVDATVVAVGADHSTVVLADPAVQAVVDGHLLPLGEEVRLRIDSADPVARSVHLSPA